MAVLGLGLAALGRPGYLTVGHGDAIGADRSVEALQARSHQVCDAAWAGGIRWFDAARSYGRAEQFLSAWLSHRGVEPQQVMVSSKWGYTYTADWRVEVEVPEVKDHSAAALARQWPETQALLGPWLRLYQVHSATLESGILEDTGVSAVRPSPTPFDGRWRSRSTAGRCSPPSRPPGICWRPRWVRPWPRPRRRDGR
jgi:aryl-alcohol dehydrogenase-like predicted oxidoreductase